MYSDSSIMNLAFDSRPLTLDTLDWVANAYYEEWGYETEGPDELARLVARWFCSHVVTQATFGHLLVKDEQLAGVTLGSVHGDRPLLAPLPDDWNEARLHERILRYPEGPSTLRIYETMFALNESLRREAQTQGNPCSAELLFLWVSPKHRGEGLSKTLLNRAMDTFRQRGQSDFCLFTDSHCDVSFYQRAPWRALTSCAWPDDIPQMPQVKELMFARDLF